MIKNIICIQHQNYNIYIEYFDHETVEDIKNLLVTKYEFIDDENFELFQNTDKLNLDFKMKDIKTKRKLYVKGSKKQKESVKKEKIDESPLNINYLSTFHEMGFKDYDEIIDNLIRIKGCKVEDVIAILLKKKSRKKRIKI